MKFKGNENKIKTCLMVVAIVFLFIGIVLFGLAFFISPEKTENPNLTLLINGAILIIIAFITLYLTIINPSVIFKSYNVKMEQAPKEEGLTKSEIIKNTKVDTQVANDNFAQQVREAFSVCKHCYAPIKPNAKTCNHCGKQQ